MKGVRCGRPSRMPGLGGWLHMHMRDAAAFGGAQNWSVVCRVGISSLNMAFDMVRLLFCCSDAVQANCPECCPAYRANAPPYDTANFTSPGKARVWLPFQELGLEWHNVGMVLQPAQVKIDVLSKLLLEADSSAEERLAAARAWAPLFEPDALLEYVLYMLGKVRSRKNTHAHHRDLLMAACVIGARAKSNPVWA